MFKKVVQKCWKMLKKYFADFKYFGFKIASLNFICEFSMLPFLKNRMDKISDKKDYYINQFLTSKFDYLIKEFQDKKLENKKGKKIIWCFWYQGMENAPLLVKKCFESLKKNAKDYQVVLITKENYSSYVKIPQFIIEKVEKKIITLTHFSDILRAGLLKEHGGIWVDATIYFTTDIFKEFNDKAFNSTILQNSNLHCTGYFMGGGINNLFNFLYTFFLEYHKKYDVLIDYFLIDYVLNIAYHNLEYCKEVMDKETIENPNKYLLTSKFNSEYERSEYQKLMQSAPYFKLSYKRKYDLKTKEGKQTNYAFFIKS